MTEKQTKSLLAFAREGSRVIGTKRCPISSWECLRKAGLVRPEGQNDSPYTGTWLLTEDGIATVAEFLNGAKH